MILLTTRMTERRPLDVTRDAWRDIARESYRAVGVYWVENYLEEHFKIGAAQKYGYKWRSRAYRDRKDRAFAFGRPFQKGGAPVIAGSNQPNVLTGRMKQDLMSQNIVKAFPTRCTITMYGPDYLTTRFYKKAQPDKPAEITKVTREEARQLNRVLIEEIFNRLDAHRGQRITNY